MAPWSSVQSLVEVIGNAEQQLLVVKVSRTMLLGSRRNMDSRKRRTLDVSVEGGGVDFLHAAGLRARHGYRPHHHCYTT